MTQIYAIKIDNHIQVTDLHPSKWDKSIDKNLKESDFYTVDFFKVNQPELGNNQKYAPLLDSDLDVEALQYNRRVVDLTIEEKERKAIQLQNQLKEVVATLEIGAKKKAINKNGSRNYIESQERLYHQKYLSATEEKEDYFNLISDEAAAKNKTIQELKSQIIENHLISVGLNDAFSAMIEIARQKVSYLLTQLEITKATEVLKLIKSITISTTSEEINSILETIKNY